MTKSALKCESLKMFTNELKLVENNKQRNSFNGPYVQTNLGELIPEMYSSYSALSITVTAPVAPIPSNHLLPFTMIHSITRFYVHIIHIHNLYPYFLGLPLSNSLNLQSSILFDHHHHHPFLKHVHTITAYFFGTLLLCLLFLTAALIQ